MNQDMNHNQEVTQPKKSGTSKNIIIVLLVLVVCGLSGYLVYDKVFSNSTNVDKDSTTLKNKNKNKTEVIKKEEKPEEVSVDENIQNLYQTLRVGMGQYCGIWNYFTTVKVEAKDIPNSIVSSIVLSQFYNKGIINPSNGQKDSFTADQVDSEVDRIFGKKYPYQHQTILNYQYNNSDRTYREGEAGFGGSCGPTSLDKIVKAEKMGDQLYVYSRVLFHIEGDDDTKYYSDYERRQMVTVERDASGSALDSSYMKGSLYKVTFTLEDGNYVFASSEPVSM